MLTCAAASHVDLCCCQPAACSLLMHPLQVLHMPACSAASCCTHVHWGHRCLQCQRWSGLLLRAASACPTACQTPPCHGPLPAASSPVGAGGASSAQAVMKLSAAAGDKHVQLEMHYLVECHSWTYQSVLVQWVCCHCCHQERQRQELCGLLALAGSSHSSRTSRTLASKAAQYTCVTSTHIDQGSKCDGSALVGKLDAPSHEVLCRCCMECYMAPRGCAPRRLKCCALPAGEILDVRLA
jgi:hypothetical protein